MPNTKLIRIRLIEKGWTVKDLATRLGMACYDCSKLIRGQRPFYRYRQGLARVLGVGLDEIFPEGVERRKQAS